MPWREYYGANMIKNPSAEEGTTLYWEDDSYDLDLGGASGGTFTLTDGTTTTGAIAFGATAATIETELDAVYGVGAVTVTGAAGSFLIVLSVSDTLEGDFALLTGATSPSVNVSTVTVVAGGVEGSYCFRFEPTASMRQTGAVPGLPPDVEMAFYFLPGRDIQSAAAVKAQIILSFIYGDGSTLRHVIPGKSFVEGYWV